MESQDMAVRPHEHTKDLLDMILDVTGRLAEVLRTSRDAARTLAAFDDFAPTLLAYGEDETEIAEMRQALEADPHRGLLALGAGAAREAGYTMQRIGDGLTITDPETGKTVVRLRLEAPDVPTGYGPREEIPEASATALRRDPWLAEEFDAKYGQGRAAHVLEGR